MRINCEALAKPLRPAFKSAPPWQKRAIQMAFWRTGFHPDLFSDVFVRNSNFSVQKLFDRAQTGDMYSMYSLAAFFAKGIRDRSGRIILRKNARRSIMYYSRAAKLGDPCSQLELGNCLSQGIGVKKDIRQALIWYRRALRAGYVSAATNIAVLYHKSNKRRQAYQWYCRAASLGDGDALVNVGEMLYEGVGVRRDYRKAIAAFRKAIKSQEITLAGKQDAMCWLGYMYLKGQGVRQSRSIAKQWLLNANSDNDHQRAQSILMKLEDSGPETAKDRLGVKSRTRQAKPMK
jgi:TPR repeat protein